MARNPPTPRVPRDQLPPISDPRWEQWSRQLRQLIDRNPVGWPELRAYADLIGTSLMAVRNLLGYLEEQGYAAIVVTSRREPLRWCGCTEPCDKQRRGCRKRRSKPA